MYDLLLKGAHVVDPLNGVNHMSTFEQKIVHGRFSLFDQLVVRS